MFYTREFSVTIIDNDFKPIMQLLKKRDLRNLYRIEVLNIINVGGHKSVPDNQLFKWCRLAHALAIAGFTARRVRWTYHIQQSLTAFMNAHESRPWLLQIGFEGQMYAAMGGRQ